MPTNIFLPVITRARELDSRLLLAARLCQDGHTAYLGLTRTLTAAARLSAPGIYHQPILNAGPEARLREMKALGHWLFGWDEEGLVYPSGHWYRSDRAGSGTIDVLDMVVAWGSKQRGDIGPLIGPDGPRAVTIGNPRADMLRAPYRASVDLDAEAIRRRFGRFVLINTNFDLVNHLDGADRFHHRLRKSGYFADAGGSGRLMRWVAYRRFMFATFLAGIPAFLQMIGDRRVVLRPHPSEDPAPWLELADRYPQLAVEPPIGSVLPWLAAAEVLIHNSCTTAVEAFALGTRVIAIRPPGLDPVAESPLPNELSHCVADWVEAARAVVAEEGGRTQAQEKHLATFIAGFPSQDSIDFLARLIAGPSKRLATTSGPDAALFADENIGMVTTLKDQNARLPPFDDDSIAHAERVLASSPSGPTRLTRMHEYAIAVSPA